MKKKNKKPENAMKPEPPPTPPTTPAAEDYRLGVFSRPTHDGEWLVIQPNVSPVIHEVRGMKVLFFGSWIATQRVPESVWIEIPSRK